MDMILASGSPRRAQLLQALGVRFTVVAPSPGAEGALPPRLRRVELLHEMLPLIALSKARDVAASRRGHDGVVVGADTTVFFKGHILGKPRNPDEARSSLKSLSGEHNRVLTAVAVIDLRSGRELTAVDETRVRFRPLSEPEIERYLASGEPLDKAGSYGIQGLGGLLVDEIQGRYDTVVGLSLASLETLLGQLALSLYDFR